MSATLQGGVFFLRSNLHHKVVTVVNARSGVICSTLNSNQPLNQLFVITQIPSVPTYFHITNVGTRHVLDIDHGQTGKATILAWPNNGRLNQMWTFRSIGGSFGNLVAYLMIRLKSPCLSCWKESKLATAVTCPIFE